MLTRLVASGGEKTRTWSPRTVAVSLLAHGLVLAGTAWATTRAVQADPREAEEEVTFVELEEPEPEAPAEPEPEPPPPPETPPATPPPPQGFQELLPPEIPPAELPPPDLSQPPVRAEDFGGVGRAGGAASGVAGGVPTNLVPEDTSEVFALEETGVKPEILNLREVQRLLERNYPQRYADAGIAGQVQVKFMIDTDGRVSPGSVVVVSASEDAFGDAAARSVERFRFKPIVYRGAPVRVWATMPISFRPAN